MEVVGYIDFIKCTLPCLALTALFEWIKVPVPKRTILWEVSGDNWPIICQMEQLPCGVTWSSIIPSQTKPKNNLVSLELRRWSVAFHGENDIAREASSSSSYPWYVFIAGRTEVQICCGVVHRPLTCAQPKKGDKKQATSDPELSLTWNHSSD